MKTLEQPARNSVTVESPYGLRCFALRLGDVTAAPDPVLVVPTHAHPGFPPSGQVMEAVSTRFGANFDRIEPIVGGLVEDSPRLALGELGPGTFRLLDKGEFVGKEILMVRIPGQFSAELSGSEPLEVLGHALWTLFGSLAALELRESGLTSMAMPLLAATRGYEIRDLLKVILYQSLNWLRVAREMSAVNFYFREEAVASEWATVMDEVLGRRSVDAAQNALAGAFRAETLALLGGRRVTASRPDWQPVLAGLRESLGSAKIPIERVAVEARRLAELIVAELVSMVPNAPAKHTLAEGIAHLRRDNRVAPWILSHLDSLRHFGNAAAHTQVSAPYQPPTLREEDLLALLASLNRVIEFMAAEAKD